MEVPCSWLRRTAYDRASAANQGDRGPDSRGSARDRHRNAQLERELAAAKARIEILERDNRDLNSQLAEIAALAAGAAQTPVEAISDAAPRPQKEAKPVQPLRLVPIPASSDGIHPAARK